MIELGSLTIVQFGGNPCIKNRLEDLYTDKDDTVKGLRERNVKVELQYWEEWYCWMDYGNMINKISPPIYLFSGNLLFFFLLILRNWVFFLYWWWDREMHLMQAKLILWNITQFFIKKNILFFRKMQKIVENRRRDS